MSEKGYVSMDEYLWPHINETKKTFELAEDPDPIWDGLQWRQGPQKPVERIAPGERFILPKQRQLLRDMFFYDITCWGGAGGGGKSVFVTKADVHSHIWLDNFYRRKHGKYALHKGTTGIFAETRVALYDRQVANISKWVPEWFGTWSESKYEIRVFERWGGGRRIYRGLDKPQSFRSLEMFGAGFDESTQQPWDAMMEVTSRLRAGLLKGLDEFTGFKVRPWCLMMTNPGGVSHEHHVQNFVDDSKRPGPQSSSFLDDDGEPIVLRGNRFIKCLPTENPMLDPYWYADLEKNKPESIKRAILEGRWDGMEGMYFDMLHEQVQLVSHKRYERLIEDAPKYLGVDIGGLHPFGACWLAMCLPDKDHPEGFGVFYREYEEIGNDLNIHKRNISELQKNDRNLLYGVISHDAFREGLTVATNSTTMEVLSRSDSFGPGMHYIPADNARSEGWSKLARGFNYEGQWVEDGKGYRKLQVKREPMLYVTDRCPLLWKELKNLLIDKTKDNDVIKSKGAYQVGFGDDLADAARYVYMLAGLSEESDMHREQRDEYEPPRPRNPFEDRLRGRTRISPVTRF